jgi:DNA primase
VKTLAHELGHALLHDPADFDGTTLACCGIQEVEAESIAYLVAATHGLTTDDYTFPYVTSWAVDVDAASPEAVVEQTGQRVMRIAAHVLKHLEPPTLHVPAAELAPTTEANPVATATARVHADAPPTVTATPTADHDRDRLIAAHRAAMEVYREQLFSTAGGGPRAYLANRGIGHVLTRDSRWQVGYASDDKAALTEHLRAARFTDTAIETAGLAVRDTSGALLDRFRDRIMFPLRNVAGETVAFIGLARPGAGPAVPTYLNSPDTPIYRQDTVLYGLAEQRDLFLAGLRPVIVQHPLDVLAVAATHSPSSARPAPAITPTGDRLTAQQVALLARYGPGTANGVTVAFSGDRNGRAAAVHASELLNAWRHNAHAVQLRAGENLTDVLRTDGAHALRKILDDPRRTVPLGNVRLNEPLTSRHDPTAPLNYRDDRFGSWSSTHEGTAAPLGAPADQTSIMWSTSITRSRPSGRCRGDD